MQSSSPKSGVFNKLKKKLTKGRRYEIVGADDPDNGAGKLQKLEAMYGKLPTSQGGAGVKSSSRDSSPSICGSPQRTLSSESPQRAGSGNVGTKRNSSAESPQRNSGGKRNALDSPQRANLSEKDTNKTNTYTKDPTKDQLKKTSSSGGSPIKEVKNGGGNNNKTQGDGPIIFINNTYDLPPIIPINKGAIISDRRQRSRERSSSLNKENGSSTDKQHGDQAGSSSDDENKENSKSAASKSPYKTQKREKLNSTKSPTRQSDGYKSPTRHAEGYKSPTRHSDGCMSPTRQFDIAGNKSPTAKKQPDDKIPISKQNGDYKPLGGKPEESVSQSKKVDKGDSEKQIGLSSQDTSAINSVNKLNGKVKTNTVVLAGINNSKGITKPIVATIPTVPTTSQSDPNITFGDNKQSTTNAAKMGNDHNDSKSSACLKTGNQNNQNSTVMSSSHSDNFKIKLVDELKSKIAASPQFKSEIVAINSSNARNGTTKSVLDTIVAGNTNIGGNGSVCFSSFLSPEKDKTNVTPGTTDNKQRDPLNKTHVSNGCKKDENAVIFKKCVVANPTSVVKVGDSTVVVKAGPLNKSAAVVVNLQQSRREDKPSTDNNTASGNKTSFKSNDNIFAQVVKPSTAVLKRDSLVVIQDDLPPPPAYMLNFTENLDSTPGENGGCGGGLSCFNGMMGISYSGSNTPKVAKPQQPLRSAIATDVKQAAPAPPQMKKLNGSNLAAQSSGGGGNKQKPLPPPRKSSSGDFSPEKSQPVLETRLVNQGSSEANNKSAAAQSDVKPNLRDGDESLSNAIHAGNLNNEAKSTSISTDELSNINDNINFRNTNSTEIVKPQNNVPTTTTLNHKGGGLFNLFKRNTNSSNTSGYLASSAGVANNSSDSKVKSYRATDGITATNSENKQKTVMYQDNNENNHSQPQQKLLPLKSGGNQKLNSLDDRNDENIKDINKPSEQQQQKQEEKNSSIKLRSTTAVGYITNDKNDNGVKSSASNIYSGGLDVDEVRSNKKNQIGDLVAGVLATEMMTVSGNMPSTLSDDEDEVDYTLLPLIVGHHRKSNVADKNNTQLQQPSTDWDKKREDGCSADEKVKDEENNVDANEYIGIEEYTLVAKRLASSKANSLSGGSSCGSQESMDIGYTSLADVEKIFGSKGSRVGNKKESDGAKNEAAPKLKPLNNNGRSKISSNPVGENGDTNGNNVMKGHVIKCDVSIQGCDVIPVKRGIPNTIRSKIKPAAPPPPTLAAVADTTAEQLRAGSVLYKARDGEEESQYGSLGDYSSKQKQVESPLAAYTSSGARPKQKVINPAEDYVDAPPIPLSVSNNKNTQQAKTNKSYQHYDSNLDISGYKRQRTRDSSSSSNLDVNLNVEVERGISHESGYETAGSGLRSHSSSSNEFIQNDSSSYSLMSEQGGVVNVTNTDTKENDSKKNLVDLNDSTSSDESAEMRHGPVYRETLEKRENPTIVANLYAFIPKGQQQHDAKEVGGTDAHPLVCDNKRVSELHISTADDMRFDRTISRSSLHSPNSGIMETALDDIDSEAYTDEVDYGFEDYDCEDDDYLPPIPTRNYNSEERDLDGNTNCSNDGDVVDDNTPPLMRVILNNKDKISSSTKNSKIQNLSSLDNVNKSGSESSIVGKFVDSNIGDIKNKDCTVTAAAAMVEISNKNTLFKSVNINHKSIVPDLEPAIIVSTAIVQQKHNTNITTSVSHNNNNKSDCSVLDEVFIEKTQDINEGLLTKVKNAVSGKSGGLTTTTSSSASSSSTDVSSDISTKEVLTSLSKASPKSKNSVIRCLQSITQSHGGNKSCRFSPVKRKSYEKVERSVPIKDIEVLEQRSPKKRDTKLKFGNKNHKKLSIITTSSKESLDKSSSSLASSITKGDIVVEKSEQPDQPLDLSKKSKDQVTMVTSNEAIDLSVTAKNVENNKPDIINQNNEKKSENKELKETPVKLIHIATSVKEISEVSNSIRYHKTVPDTPSKHSERSGSDITELYNASFSSDSTLSLDQQFWASFDEPVHMSIDEVITQAKDLGIPLTLTRSGVPRLEEVISQANDLGIPLSMSKSGGRVICGNDPDPGTLTHSHSKGNSTSHVKTSTSTEIGTNRRISESGSASSSAHHRNSENSSASGTHNPRSSHQNKTSESESLSSIDSVISSPSSHRGGNTQTLPCPKHGTVITPDKLPRKKPGTLKDKFASLFAKKSGSISPSKHNSESIQKRSLPPPPSANSVDFDIVDGVSPSRRHHRHRIHENTSSQYPKSSACEVHDGNHTISSPNRHHSSNSIFHSNRHHNSSTISHSRHSNNERHCNCSPNSKKNNCKYCSNSPRNNSKGSNLECNCHHGSGTTPTIHRSCKRYNKSSIEECDCCLDEEESSSHFESNKQSNHRSQSSSNGNNPHHSGSGIHQHRNHHDNVTTSRRHHSSSRASSSSSSYDQHSSNGNQHHQKQQQQHHHLQPQQQQQHSGGHFQATPGRHHHHSNTIHHHHRDRSQSRDSSISRRSGGGGDMSSKDTVSSCSRSSRSAYVAGGGGSVSSSQKGYQTTPVRHTRSSSSSGIVERCPPSPAPSGTSSVLSAPSAFTYPTSTGGLNGGSSGSARDALVNSITSSFLQDCSPTRTSHSSCNNNNISGNADFIGSLSKLKDVGWYWGPLSWDDAEAKLSTKPDGAFLVRDSSDDRYILSLSFRSQGTTHHTRIEHYKGMFSFYSQPKSHGAATIIEFVEKAMDHSRSGKFLYFLRPRAPGLPPAPVQLLYPISRFHNMQTLQHLCRFSILKHVRRDHIGQLPVPQRIKDYLEMSQYYIEYLGDDTAAR